MGVLVRGWGWLVGERQVTRRRERRWSWGKLVESGGGC